MGRDDPTQASGCPQQCGCLQHCGCLLVIVEGAAFLLENLYFQGVLDLGFPPR